MHCDSTDNKIAFQQSAIVLGDGRRTADGHIILLSIYIKPQSPPAPGTRPVM